MTDFQTGLMISAIGLLVTFSALGIFIGIIVILQKLFPAKAKPVEVEQTKTDEPAVIEVKTEAGADEIVAVLAAVAYLRAQRSGQLGSELLSGPGLYRTSR